ncbi:hypothetical protein KAR91_69705 [Candidatus Pacearchaeota archaeon]|nr:hypothetical protein [Candidatus Pacearchaeota archaeon]
MRNCKKCLFYDPCKIVGNAENEARQSRYVFHSSEEYIMKYIWPKFPYTCQMYKKDKTWKTR